MVTPEHTCHAIGCETPCARRMLMCRKHWYMVPPALRVDVWAEYVPGQEETMTPTKKYLKAANAAIQAVAKKEGKSIVDAAPTTEALF